MQFVGHSHTSAQEKPLHLNFDPTHFSFRKQQCIKRFWLGVGEFRKHFKQCFFVDKTQVYYHFEVENNLAFNNEPLRVFCEE